MKKYNKGFTLIEVLVVIGIIAILAAIVVVAINPAKRFQDANNAQRQANVESILSALQQKIVDGKGSLGADCPIIGSTATNIGTGSGLVNLTNCLTKYLAVLPYDPDGGSAEDTLYTIKANADSQITVASVKNTAITMTR